MNNVVLVAEDSATARATVRIYLDSHGYSVIEAADGLAALRAARREHPDVILLDVEMPVMDGHSVLAALRADESLCDTPVVFLTGRTDPEEVVAGLSAGAHDYLRKPFDMAELVARVSAAARVKRLQDELRRRNEELDLVSRVDALTGLWNRRHVDEHLRTMCSAARRHGFPVNVLLFDLDHFKSINDQYGHTAGDGALRAAAASFLEHMRSEDVLGRWGGEEFLAVLPYVEVEGAAAVAERARAALEARDVHLGEGVVLTLTTSVGVDGAIGDALDADALVRVADRSLYEAKATGRNRVVVAREPDAD